MRLDTPENFQNATGKNYMLRFLPYLETRGGQPASEAIGYEPAWVRRGRGYGRWEECFYTEVEARERMATLIASGAIEDIELQHGNGPGFSYTVIAKWRDNLAKLNNEGGGK